MGRNSYGKNLKKAVNPSTLPYSAENFLLNTLRSALKIKEPTMAENKANNKIPSNEGQNPMLAQLIPEWNF